MSRAILLALMLSVLATEATAQQSQQTFYDGTTGKITARSITGSNRAVTFFDASGKVTSRTATTGNTTTVYDARAVASSPKPRGRNSDGL